MSNLFPFFLMGISMGIAITSLLYEIFTPSQKMKVKGKGNIVNQSGCKVGGDLVGGDLIKNEASPVKKCPNCGGPV